MKTPMTNIQEFPLVLSVEDVARIMNIGRVRAYELVHTQGFPCKLIGKRFCIPRDRFFNWLNAEDISA